jgi:transposase
MVHAYSHDLKERILHFHLRGETMRSTAEAFNVSLGFVHRILNFHQRFGQIENPYTAPRHGRRIITTADEDFIRSLTRARPSIYLDEIQHELESVRGVFVSVATISRTLVRMGVSKKSLSRSAAERNEELRTLWELELPRLNDPDLFVFLDESAVDNKTVQRSSGWSAVGGQSAVRSTFLRGKRHSILPALSSEGIVALEIIEGSVNKERFLKFLRDQVVCFP